MAISMQGSWTVSVKSKSAAFTQRFIIEGASSGNGTYVGETTTPPVHVSGPYWSIRIQNNPGSGFIDSSDRIKFPTSTATDYRFDIESNDAGADEDFNDLILTCAMPRNLGEFLVYGNVTYYSGACFINPCYPHWIVVETAAGLKEALRYPQLKAPIEQLYPQLVFPPPPPPGPGPDPGPFTPIALPLAQDTLLPEKRAQQFQLSSSPAMEKARSSKTNEATTANLTSAVRSLSISNPAKTSINFDRVAISDLSDKLRFLCQTGPLPGFALRFLEYDRTAAELAGGPYTGTGGRENLGQCVTDRNGNYIFRFSRNLGDFLQEVFSDTAPSENPLIEAMPDLIAQLLDSTAPGGVAYESFPYWNVPNLKRIDLCIPASTVHRPLAGCQGGRVYQQIGFIRVGIPEVIFEGGRVTCTDNSAPYIPQTSCAAWGGNLRFSACFLDENKASSVTQYTIRHQHWNGSSWSGWEFYQENLSLQRVGFIAPQKVGPFPRSLQLVAPGPLVANCQAYDNIELNFAWAASDWFTKAGISSGGGSPAYAPSPGPVRFEIQGYDAAGLQVAGKHDQITLFIDNDAPLLNIASVGMGSQALSGCQLFHLSGEPVPAPLTVRFRAIQNEGFLGRYDLSVTKGNLGGFPIARQSGGFITATPPYVSASPCHQLFGTRPPDEPLAVGDFVTSDIVPAAPAVNWLDPGQPFCTFVVNLSCTKRVTDGTQPGEYSFGPVQYFLGIEQ